MPRLKGPVPQVQAKEGPMPQLVKKRRSGWAVLAVGALVASILAFGATPAAARGKQEPDAEATWTACLGPAMADQGFTDVSMDGTHYDNINCLAYYGVTTGKTADSYDPGASVTRSEMALFLTRMAGKVDVALDDDSDAGFTDLDATGDDRVDAINRLANAGIMPGRTATTFSPTDTVTRADMALHMFRFLDLALDSVLIDMLPDSVEGNEDGVGKIELNDDDVDGIGERVNDYFGDVRATLPAHMDDIIGAVYELGVTNGTNGMVGERGTFEPAKAVSRAEMASFIMRVLGHTNLRPAGLTAQQTSLETQVSVRDADFAPIVNERVELFQSSFARDAFDRSGRCIDRFVYVDPENPNFSACEIDAGDARTDATGNVKLQPGSGGARPTITCLAGTPYRTAVDQYASQTSITYRLEAAGLVDPEAEYKAWAWTGSFGDTVDSNTDLFEAVPANQPHPRTAAVTAVFSGGKPHPNDKVKMGSSLVYQIQLVDRWGQPVGPNPSGNQSYTVTIQTRDPGSSTVTIKSVETRTPDDDGNIRIVVRNPDPIVGIDNDDVEVSVTVTRSAGTAAEFRNTLRFVNAAGATDATDGTADTAGGFDSDGSVTYETTGTADHDADSNTAPQRRIIGAQAPVEIFSDDDPLATRISVSPSDAGRELSGRNRNSIAVTVLDQYGNPFKRGAGYNATSVVTPPTGTGTPSEFPNNDDADNSGELNSDNSGRFYLNYNYVANSAGVEALGVRTGAATATTPVGTATVYWGAIAGNRNGTAVSLLLADPSMRRLFADVPVTDDTAARPTIFLYGADDSYFVGQRPTPLSLAQFQEVLMVAVSHDPRITLNYNADPTDNTVDTQTQLTWEAFNNNRPNDRATWTLEGLRCTPPSGADAEPTIS